MDRHASADQRQRDTSRPDAQLNDAAVGRESRQYIDGGNHDLRGPGAGRPCMARPLREPRADIRLLACEGGGCNVRHGD